MSPAEDRVNETKSPDEQIAEAVENAACSGAPLSERLSSIVATESRLFPVLLPMYDRLIARAAAGEAGTVAPAPGAPMADAGLLDVSGEIVSLSTLWQERPLVVSINRGNWCPFCATQLRMISEYYAKIQSLGAEVVSIVPETLEFSETLASNNSLPFKVLSDIDLGYALQLGLVIWMGEEIKSAYIAGGLDLSNFQANDGWFLPIPATFVVDRGGLVRARFIDPDFRRRMPMDDIMAALAMCRNANGFTPPG